MGSPNKRSTLQRELTNLDDAPGDPIISHDECINDLGQLIQSTIKVTGGEEEKGLVKVERNQNKKTKSNLIVSHAALTDELKIKVVCSNCGEKTMVLEVQDQVGLESEVRLNCQKCISNNCSLVQKTNNNTCKTHTKAQRKFFTSELNYQAVLATYYTGSTVGNLQFIYSSLGLDHLKNWEYLHYRNCEEVQEQILTLTEEIVSRSLVSEIIETMKLKYNMTIKQVNDFLFKHKTQNERLTYNWN